MLYYHLVFHRACVAQLAEQLTRNEQVAGSNPATSSKKRRPEGRLFFKLVRSRSLSPVGGNPATSSKKDVRKDVFFLSLSGVEVYPP